MFRKMAERCVVQMLESGSQVFIYPREEFESADPYSQYDKKYSFTDVDMFVERTILTAQHIDEKLTIDPRVEEVASRAVPLSSPNHIVHA